MSTTKNIIFTFVIGLLPLTTLADNIMKRTSDGTYIINTTELAADVEGYAAPTPVEVYIKKNKIVKVVVLTNKETPKYNAKVKKHMVHKYEGMNVKKGKVQEIDGVTGATFTSHSIHENVRRAVAYYKTHK